jgi:hypothetical protein
MLKRLLSGLIGETPLHERVDRPQNRPDYGNLSQVFSPERAARMESFARQHLGFKGDFSTLRSVVDLAACAGKLASLDRAVSIEPQDFIRRHSEAGHEVPEGYYTTGLANIQAFMASHKRHFISADMMQPFLPDGTSLAQAAWGTEGGHELLKPSNWQHDVADYELLVRNLWGHGEGASRLLKDAKDAKADETRDDIFHDLIRSSSRAAVNEITNHRGTLMQSARSSMGIPMRVVNDSALYLNNCIRHGVMPYDDFSFTVENKLEKLFATNENGETMLEMMLRQPAGGTAERFLLNIQRTGQAAKAVLCHATLEQINTPILRRYIDATFAQQARDPADFWSTELVSETSSPLGEPWLLTAERIGLGDAMRGILQARGCHLTVRDLHLSGRKGATYLELLAGPEGTELDQTLRALPKLGSLFSPVAVLSDHLAPAGDTSPDKLGLDRAFSKGLIGAAIAEGRVSQLVGVLTSRGYTLDSDWLDKPVTYQEGIKRKSLPKTLRAALVHPDCGLSIKEQVSYLGLDSLKAQLASMTEAELRRQGDTLRAVSSHLTAQDMFSLLTKDKRPILRAAIENDAVDMAIVQDWITDPAALLSPRDNGSLYEQLQDKYGPARLLRPDLLAAQPALLPEVVSQSKDMEKAAVPLSAAFSKLTEDLRSGQRAAADLGFTYQDWTEPHGDNEPAIMKAARAGLFLPLRAVLAYAAEPVSATVLAKVRGPKDSLVGILQKRGEAGALANAAEWGDDLNGYLDFRTKIEGNKLDREAASFQFYTAKLKARHRAPAA